MLLLLAGQHVPRLSTRLSRDCLSSCANNKEPVS
jgi:hypothetical protein